MKNTKKILGIVLVVMLLALAMSISAFAATTVTTESELNDALASGGEVTLGSDIVVNTVIEIPKDVTSTLNLNGCNITSGYQAGSDTKHIYPFDVYGNLTIKDETGNGSISGRGILVKNGSKVTVESGSLYAIDSNGGSVFYQYGGDIVINGGHVEQKAEGTYNFAINAAGGTVTVNGGWVGGNHGAIAAGGAAVEINGGTLVCTGTAGMTDNVLYTYDDGSIVINGGTFIADNDGPAGGCCVYDANGGTTINAGNFSNSSGGDVWGTTGTTINGGTFENLTEKSHVTVGSTIVNGGKAYTKTESGELVEAATEIKVATLAELIEALEADNNLPIVATAIIVIDGDTVLNLNGKTVKAENMNVIRNDSGNLVITNGTIERTGTTAGYAFNVVSGTVKLENVTIIGGMYTSGTSAEIVNSNISQHHSSRHTIYAYNCKVDINGGTYHNANAGNSTIFAAGTSVVTIENGTFSIDNGKATFGWTSCMLDASNGGAYVINGGEFKGHFRIQANSSMTINGGTFENTHGEGYSIYNGGVVTVKGGTFTDASSQAFAKSNLAEGYELGEDGKVISTVSYVATVNGVQYTDIQEAINAANGETVVILENIDLADTTVTVPAGTTVTLDLNGKAISGVCNADQASMFIIENTATLTVKDSATNGKITYASGTSKVGFGMDVKGNLILESGTIELTGSWNLGFAVDVRPNAWGTAYTAPTTFTMNGGKIVSSDTGVRVDSNSSNKYEPLGVYFTMNDGVIESGWDAIFVQHRYANKLYVNVKNGYVTGSNSALRIYGDVVSDVYFNVEGGTFVGELKNLSATGNGSTTITGGVFAKEPEVIPDGYSAIKNLDGMYVVGVAPTATVKDYGPTIIPAGEYGIWDGKNYTSKGTVELPLSFVMQFIANQTAEDVANSPYADWYGDFVITFTGIENGSFTADGCYLAGYYGDFGWVKIPVDGMKIENGVSYPVMLGVGLGQKYDYICSGVQDFKCALYITPEILAANPGLKVNLELAVVDNSKGQEAAADALADGNAYSVVYYDYEAKDFIVNYVASVGEKNFTSLADAFKYANANGGTITLLEDITIDTETFTINSDAEITLDMNGKKISVVDKKEGSDTRANYELFYILGKLTVTGNGTIELTSTYDRDWNAMSAIFHNRGGVLTIENGTYTNKGGTDMAYVIDNSGNSFGDVVTTIKGGTFTTTYIAVRNRMDTYGKYGHGSVTLNINGGELTGKYAVWGHVSSTGVKGSVNVTGGKLTSAAGNTAILMGTDSTGEIAVAVSGGTFSAAVDESYCAQGYIPVANNDGTYGVKEGAFVAEVNGVKYESITDALAAANAGETIKLLADVTANSIIVIDKAITLDGNGHTITYTGAGANARAFNINTNGTVTIKNITVNAEKAERAFNVIQKPATLILDNVTATAANYTVNVATSAGAANVAIKNSTLNGLCTVNVGAAGANVTIADSTINCNDNNATAGEAYAALSLNREAIGGSIVATNTIVNVTAGSDSVKGRNGAENGTVTINGSTDDVYVVVAVITYAGSPYYHGFASLAQAIEFAKAGDTITLIRDITSSEIITINKAITIDGNGKTLTSTAARAINVETDGKVVISNLTINAGERAINIINKVATVELNKVTATATNNAVMIATSAGAVKLTINDSDLTGLAVVNVSGAGSQVEINNTKITNVDKSEKEIYGAITVWSSAAGATVSVNGGEIGVADDSNKAIVFPADATVTGVDNVKYIVATIGDGGYFTLQAAVQYAAENGGVIKLIRDIELTETITVTGTVTLDLNGHTITGTDNNNVGNFYLINVNKGNLTINDTVGTGAITLTATVERNWSSSSVVVANNQGTVTVNGGTIEHLGGTSMAYAIDNLTNGTIGDANLVINGGKVESTYFAVRQFANSNTKENNVTVNGGNVGYMWIQSPNSYVNNADLTVKAGTVSGICLSGVNAEITLDAKADCVGEVYGNAPAGECVIVVDGKYTLTKAVAKIGDTYYTTLQEAFNAGGNVVLLDNVTITSTIKLDAGKTVTLDLNGCVISGTCNASQASLVYVENGATLTVKDTSKEQTGKITFAQGTSNIGWTIDVKGALVLKSGTIELTGDSWNIGYAVDVRPNAWGTAYTEGTTFVMDGGKIISSDGGVRVASSSDAKQTNVSASFTMNGGYIDAAWDGVFVQQSDAIYDKLSVTINGGTIESDLNPIRVYGPAATGYVDGNNCMNITLAGGKFTYTGAATQEWLIDGILRVGGGSSAATIVENGSVVVSSEIAQSKAAPEGYKWSANDNGTYTLAECNYVAEANGVKYETLAEAIAAGGEVKLLADITLTESITVTGTVKLDLAGFDITMTLASVNGTTFAIKNNGTLTITNSADEVGEIRLTYTGERNSNASISTIGNYGTLNIEGGKINCVAGNQYIAYAIDSIANSNVAINISGGEVCGGASGYCIRMFLNSTTNNNELNVTGGNVGYVWAQNTNAYANKATINVTGGTVSYVYVGAANGGMNDVSNIELNINAANVEYAPYANLTDDKYEIRLVDGVYRLVKCEYVAQVGDTKYESLEAAINAANGGTVILLETFVVEADETVVLDLKGCTIVANAVAGESYAAIRNNGILTITNGTVVCNSTTSSTSYAVNTITNCGTLTITKATISNVGKGNQIGYAIDNNSTVSNATVVIGEGAVITASGSNYFDGIRLFCNSTTNTNNVTVNGGNVSSIWMQNPSDGAVKNTLAVNGLVTITAGEVGALYIEPSSKFALDITGGNVGTVGTFNTSNSTETAIATGIKGGTFGNDVSAYVAKGYKCVYDENTSKYIIAKLISVQGTTMTLNTNLAMNFYFNRSDFDGTDYYAVIKKCHDKENGCTCEETVYYIPMSAWYTSGKQYYVIQADGIAAKEMVCNITIEIYAGTLVDGQPSENAEAVSTLFTQSVVSYIMGIYDYYSDYGIEDKEFFTLMADALVYGAEAQLLFKHHAFRADGSKILATDAFEGVAEFVEKYKTKENPTLDLSYKSDCESEKYFAGTTLSLDNTVFYNLYYAGLIGKENVVITYTFTHHDGTVHTYTTDESLEGQEGITGIFQTYTDKTGRYTIVSIDDLKPNDLYLDVNCVVTIDGVVVSNITCSVEDHCANGVNNDANNRAIYNAIMKYASSAEAYFKKQA